VKLHISVLVAFLSAAFSPPNRDAQFVMMKHRVANSYYEYASKIAVSLPYVVYCRVEMDIKLNEFSKLQVFPFGIDINALDDTNFNRLISDRENFETSYMTLCLSDVRTRISNSVHSGSEKPTK
jgi:hypothetical protein